MTKSLLKGLRNLFVKIIFFICLYFFLFEKFLTRMRLIDFIRIDCFYDYSVRHSFSRWKTAAVIFYNPCNISRAVLVSILLSKRYDN